MTPFELAEPRTLRDAAGLIDADESSVRAIAGGTALMLMMKAGVFHPTRLVSLGKIEKKYSGIAAGKDGLRIYDVTDKRLPREIGYFMAGPPEKQYLKAYGPYVRMEDVFVDTRGYIYVTGGAQQGLYILRYTGPNKN